MIDLHTHTILSDGALIPAEHIRRAEVAGYRILGIADHADLATLEVVLGPALIAARRENELGRIKVLAGVELTHVRPRHFAEATDLARKLGAHFVIAHGETIAEPVEAGTNRAAIDAGVDVLAHPGLISEGDATAAAQRGIFLEITAKRGHCLTNGHVAKLARQVGAKLIFGSDAHDGSQMPTRQAAERICLAAALNRDEVAAMFAAAEQFAAEKLPR